MLLHAPLSPPMSSTAARIQLPGARHTLAVQGGGKGRVASTMILKEGVVSMRRLIPLSRANTAPNSKAVASPRTTHTTTTISPHYPVPLSAVQQGPLANSLIHVLLFTFPFSSPTAAPTNHCVHSLRSSLLSVNVL